MDAASDGSVARLDSPVGNFISDRSDADAKYGAEVATDARASPRDDTSDLDVTIAATHVFPLEDYRQVAEGLCRHPSWMVYPKQLASCLIAACEIVHTGDVEAERKSVELTRLYRETTPSAFEKCVVFDDVVNWDRNIQLDILVACKALAELVSVKLSAALVSSPRRAADEARGRDGDAETDTAGEDEETPEESDALALLTALTWTFDRASAFHANNRFEPVPRRHRNHDLMVDVDRGLHAAAFAAVPSDARSAAATAPTPTASSTSPPTTATRRRAAATPTAPRVRARFPRRLRRQIRLRDAARVYEPRTRVARVRPGRVRLERGLRLDLRRLARVGRKKGLLRAPSTPRGKPPPRAPASSPTSASVRSPAPRGVARARRARRQARRGRTDVRKTAPSALPLPATRTTAEERKGPPSKNEKSRTPSRRSRASRAFCGARAACATRAFGGGEAERRVSEAHRAVIEGLLGVHTFNAQLARCAKST